jgi:hypothetical protein
VVETVGKFHGFVVGGGGGSNCLGFAFAAEVVVVVDEGWVGGAVVQKETLASIPVGEGCQLGTRAPQVLLFLC